MNKMFITREQNAALLEEAEEGRDQALDRRVQYGGTHTGDSWCVVVDGLM